ncbi:DUF520 family protein [Escherichia coli]
MSIEVDLQEARNAVNNASREVRSVFDFRLTLKPHLS